MPVYSTDQPDVHEVIAGMRRVVDEFDDRLLIGEVYLPISELVAYYGIEQSGAHLPFKFQLIRTPWGASHLRLVVEEYEASVPRDRWPNWVLGNHDQPRVASRLGDRQAAAAAVLLLTLRGTPTLYDGDELGMHDVEVPPEQAVDPRELRCPGRGLGRDCHRAPMPWDDTAHAGFSTSRPWLPLPDDWRRGNVAAQQGDPGSMLTLHRDLLALRRREPALSIGSHATLDLAPPFYGFLRQYRDRTIAVVLNVSGADASAELPRGCSGGAVLLSTERARGGTRVDRALHLAPHEALVIAVEPAP